MIGPKEGIFVRQLFSKERGRFLAPPVRVCEQEVVMYMWKYL